MMRLMPVTIQLPNPQKIGVQKRKYLEKCVHDMKSYIIYTTVGYFVKVEHRRRRGEKKQKKNAQRRRTNELCPR